MKKILIPACCILTSLLALTSCSNKNSSHSTSTAHTDNSAQHTSTTTAQTAQPATVNQAPAPVETIPNFTFYKVKSGMSFSNTDIPKGKKTVFILFDPSCSHCQHEAADLAKNYDKIKDVNIYFVSMNDPALQASFLETFAKELANKPNVEVLYDKNQEFIQKFHIPSQFPANYVYGSDMKFQTHWDGAKDINTIIEAYTN